MYVYIYICIHIRIYIFIYVYTPCHDKGVGVCGGMEAHGASRRAVECRLHHCRHWCQQCFEHHSLSIVLQRVAVCCSVSQCVEVCCSVLQCSMLASAVFQETPSLLCCSVLQCESIWCVAVQYPLHPHTLPCSTPLSSGRSSVYGHCCSIEILNSQPATQLTIHNGPSADF